MSDGSAKVLFDPTRSERGALLPLSRRNFKGEEHLYEAPLVIINPDTLPTKEERIAQELKDAKDLRKTHAPTIPSGPGTNGRLGTSFSEQIIKQIGLQKTGDDDPVEALRKYDTITKCIPSFFHFFYSKS